MAGEDSELVGGISVTLGASDAKLISDLAQAERLVQEWAKQAATVQLRAVFKGGTAGGAAGGTSGSAPQTVSQQQVAAIMAAVARNPAGLARIAAAQPKVVFGPGAATAAAGQQGQTAMQRAIDAELAKTGEAYDDLTGEIVKVGGAHRAQRAAVEASTRSVQKNTQVESASVDTGALAAEIKSIVGALAEFRAALSVASESAPAAATSRGGGARRGTSRLSASAQTRLQKLSAEAQAANGAPPLALATATPPRTQSNETPQERASRERNQRDQAFANAANAPRQRPRPSSDQAAVLAAQRRDEEVFARTAPNTEDQREQRIQEDIARRRANITASGSTGRTSASRIGSLFGGNQGRLIEAETRLAAARRNTTEANRAAEPFERRIAEYNDDISNTSGKVAEALTRRRDAFKEDPKTTAAFKRQTDAIKGESDALQTFDKLQSGANIARNLTAVAAGSFVFSAALKAVDIGVQAIGTAVGPTLERLSGFASTTAAYTANLADATRAANGNAQAVTAIKLASTGLSAATGQTIQPLIQQRAEVEAGNKALQDQIDSLHVFENLRRSSGSAGLTTTTGGLLGGPIGGIPSTGEQVGNLLSQQGNLSRTSQVGAKSNLPPIGFGQLSPTLTGNRALTKDQQATAAIAAQKDFASSLALVNGQLDKGGDAAAQFTQDLSGMDPRIEQTAKSFDRLSPAMAAAIRENGLYTNGIQNQADALKALQAINIAGTLPDPALLQQQFARGRGATIAAANRQQQYSLQTQIPGQQGLSALASPLLKVGTGVVAANAREQQQIVAGQQQSIKLQTQLNDYYDQGKQILIDTYKVPQDLVNSVESIGKQIASTQASISNESAAYQTAQYNYQLVIAKRNLSDIGGLTGRNFGAGQSYLGELEKQNLALSRQGQLLQFSLSQRQINFQTSLAGFQAPGVTPEERQARIKEAQIEASFAQKQLNISKQTFSNQVKIVDISNLRQGADLARQIGLLLQGRKVTIDTAQAEERLVRLQAVQAKNVAQVGTYLTKVDNLASAAMSEIQQLETAAGKAIGGVAVQVLNAYGLVIKGLTSQLNGSNPNVDQSGRPITNGRGNAKGAVGTTTGAMDMTIGEAGSETYAILRNPRAFTGAMGGGSTSVTFGDVYIRSETDMDNLVRKVTKALGREASTKGLRGVG